MTHLDKSHLITDFAQRFHDPVDAVTGKSEDHLDTPSPDGVD